MNSIPQVCTENLALPEVPIEQWLTAKQLAAHFGGLDEQSAYRWRSNGSIPPAYIKKFGNWRYKFHPAVVSLLEKDFAAAHFKPAAVVCSRPAPTLPNSCRSSAMAPRLT
jgi:hypothetical protein